MQPDAELSHYALDKNQYKRERVNAYHELQFYTAKKIPNRHGNRFGMVKDLRL